MDSRTYAHAAVAICGKLAGRLIASSLRRIRKKQLKRSKHTTNDGKQLALCVAPQTSTAQGVTPMDRQTLVVSRSPPEDAEVVTTPLMPKPPTDQLEAQGPCFIQQYADLKQVNIMDPLVQGQIQRQFQERLLRKGDGRLCRLLLVVVDRARIRLVAPSLSTQFPRIKWLAKDDKGYHRMNRGAAITLAAEVNIASYIDMLDAEYGLNAPIGVVANAEDAKRIMATPGTHRAVTHCFVVGDGRQGEPKEWEGSSAKHLRELNGFLSLSVAVGEL